METAITLSAADLLSLDRAAVFAAMGRPDLVSGDVVRHDAATMADRRRRSVPVSVDRRAPAHVDGPGIVLISCEGNPLA